jgi:hypothetical protein
MDLTKFLLTWLIASGLHQASSAFWRMFLEGNLFRIMDGLSLASIALTLAFLMGYVNIRDFQKTLDS